MNKYFLILLLLVGGVGLFSACDGAPSEEKQTILTGRIQVLVDENVAPIVREQLDVFQNSYVNARIQLVELPERSVVNNLLKDSAEVAVLTRLLRPDELSFFESRGFTPRVVQFAVDAVTLVGNVSLRDSTIDVADVLAVMQGDTSPGFSLVFDHPASGTLRYLQDLAGMDSLPAQGVYALNSQHEVLAYVHDHPDAVGVVGLNGILKPDSLSKPYMGRVRTLGVRNLPGNPGDDDFYLPIQSNLALGVYAFARPVYLINAEPRYGLGMGFAAFLSGERGQRIVLKSGLMPDSLPPREIIIRDRYRSN